MKQIIVNCVRGYYLAKNKFCGKLIDAMSGINGKDIELELNKLSYGLVRMCMKDARKFEKWKKSFAPECK